MAVPNPMATRPGPARSSAETENEPAPPDRPIAPFVTIAADDAIVIGARVLLLDASGPFVSAVDITTGNEIWRQPVPKPARHGRILQRLGERRVLLADHGGSAVFEVATGQLVASHDRAGGRFLWQRDGACGLRHTCGMQLIDCDDARPIGASLDGVVMHVRTLDGGHAPPRCRGGNVELIGRARDRLIYLFDGKMHGADAKTGKTKWQSDAYRCSVCHATSGISPDARHCWTADDSTLTAFDCHSGSQRFTATLADEIIVAVWDDGIFVETATTASHFAPSGARRWQHALTPPLRALTTNAKLPQYIGVQFSDDNAAELILYDAASGSEARREHIPKGATIVRSSGGVAVVTRLEASDRSGHPIPTRPQPMFIVERNDKKATVRFAADGARAHTLDVDGWSLGEHYAGEKTYLALYAHSQPDEVQLFVVSASRTDPPAPSSRR